MKQNERIDTVSYDYYDDSDFDWTIYISNLIIDPYYDSYISSDDFNNYIVSKYGSVVNSQSTVAFWRNNWVADESVLTVSAYNALTDNLRKYWDPVLSINNTIISYQRKQADWVVTTNQVLQLNMQLSGNTNFIIGEQVNSTSNGNAVVSYSNATVNAITNTSILIINHTEGSWPEGNSFTVSGLTSNATATVNTNSVIVLSQNIPNTELVYYSPISNYDYETEINEQKKEMVLLSKIYINDAYKQFRNLMAS